MGPDLSQYWQSNEIHSKSRTGNMTTINNDTISPVAEKRVSCHMVRVNRTRGHTLVNTLDSIVNRTILTNVWLQNGPFLTFRRPINCGNPEV